MKFDVENTGKRINLWAAALTVMFGVLISFAFTTETRAGTISEEDNIVQISGEVSATDLQGHNGSGKNLWLVGNAVLKLEDGKSLEFIKIAGASYDLTIQGDGKLTLVSNGSDGIGCGKLTVTGGDINITTSGTSNYGIRVNGGKISISGSNTVLNVTTNGAADGIAAQGSGEIEINGGTITVQTKNGDGIFAANGITVNGGKVTVTAKGNAGKGLYSSSGDISIQRGEVTAASEKYYGILCLDGDVSITGGKVTATSGGDNPGIESQNGKVTIDTKNADVHATAKGKDDAAAKEYTGKEVSPEEDPKKDDKKSDGKDGKKDGKKADKKKDTTDDDDDDDDDHHHSRSSHGTASWVLNPNEKQALVINFAGLGGGYTGGRQEQGEIAKALFKASIPAGWSEAFTFNILKDGKADYSLKKGSFTISVPAENQKAGRQFAILAMGKNGQVFTLTDTDTNPNTITVNVNFEGYAMDLISTV